VLSVATIPTGEMISRWDVFLFFILRRKTMEFLEMRGAVKLKADVDKIVLGSVLNTLKETEFVDTGYMDISLEGQTLRIHAEGTISESYSIRALLLKLQAQLTDTSMIGVTSVRWETLVVLKHWEPLSAIRLQPLNQLVFAQ